MRRVATLTLFALLAAAGCEEARPRPVGARDGGGADAARGPEDAAADAAVASDAGAPDAGGERVPDAGRVDSGAQDSGAQDSGALDAGLVDSGAPDSGPPDSGPPDSGPPDSGAPDAGPTGPIDATVIIDVDNFCNMNVTPPEISVPAGQTIMVDWFNRSRDYAVDVWLSYGGGFLDLPTGSTWDEPIPHCTGPNPHTEYADISTACSNVRFFFRCQ